MAQRVYSDASALRSMLVRRPTAKTRALDDNAANKPVINEELTTMSQLMKTITSLVIVAAAALKLRNKLETKRHAQRDQATNNNTGRSSHCTQKRCAKLIAFVCCGLQSNSGPPSSPPCSCRIVCKQHHFAWRRQRQPAADCKAKI